MTKTKHQHECPLCKKMYRSVSTHLRQTHRIVNETERKILNNLASKRRALGAGRCPKQGCFAQVVHLKRHILGHPDINEATKARLLNKENRRVALQQLAFLRNSNPTPAMVSTLDQEDEEYEEDEECPRADCGRNKAEKDQLTKEVEMLRGRIRILEGPGDAGPTPKRPSPAPERSCQPLQKQVTPIVAPPPTPEPTETEEQVIVTPKTAILHKEPHKAECKTKHTETKRQKRLKIDPAKNPSPMEKEDMMEEENVIEKQPSAMEKVEMDFDIKEFKAYIQCVVDDDQAQRRGESPMKNEPVHPALEIIFGGKSRTSKMRKFTLPNSIDQYLFEYQEFLFCPEGTKKMQENSISKASRARVFVRYMILGWESERHWKWEFLDNSSHLRAYPAVMRKLGLAPTTAILYIGHILSFLDYFQDTPPEYSQLSRKKLISVHRDVKKMYKDMNRPILGHQSQVREKKQQNLVPKRDLSSCQQQSKAKMASLLDDIENAPPEDPVTRYRFFGYMAAYLTSIYGHRSGVLTRMTVNEVRDAIGDDERGYLINVLDHKTVRKYGLAQIYLDPEEYGWCKRWLRLRARVVPSNNFFFSSLGRGEAKNMVRYFRKAWIEMGLSGCPSLLDIRTAVATYNYETNLDPKVRATMSEFMCHSDQTQGRFYALHKTLPQAKSVREMFVALSGRTESDMSKATATSALYSPEGGASSSAGSASTIHTSGCPRLSANPTKETFCYKKNIVFAPQFSLKEMTSTRPSTEISPK